MCCVVTLGNRLLATVGAGYQAHPGWEAGTEADGDPEARGSQLCEQAGSAKTQAPRCPSGLHGGEWVQMVLISMPHPPHRVHFYASMPYFYLFVQRSFIPLPGSVGEQLGSFSQHRRD